MNPRQRRAEEAKRRQQLSALEKELRELDEQENRLNEEIAQNPADYELLSANCAKLEALKARYDACFKEWMKLDTENQN